MAKPTKEKEQIKAAQESGAQDIKLSQEESKMEIAPLRSDDKQDEPNQEPSHDPDHVQVSGSSVSMPEDTKSAHKSPIAPEINAVTNKMSPGLRRHRLVVAACCGVALLFVGMSSVDLNPLISKKAVLNESLTLQTPHKLPELPSTLAFVDQHPEDLFDSTALLPVKQSTWGSPKYGFVDWSGKVLVPPKFTSYGDSNEGMTPVKLGEKENAKWGYLDGTGKLVIPFKFHTAGNFQDGTAIVTNDNDEAALIDKDGKALFSSMVRQTPERLGKGHLYIFAQQNGKTGLIDRNGQWALQPTYDRIESFKNATRDRSWFSKRSNPTWYLDEQKAADEQFFQIWKDNLCGVVDTKGNIIISPKYKQIISFSNGHAAVEINKKIGFVDSSGKVVIEPKYDYATQFDKLIAVRNGNNWQILDSTGKVQDLFGTKLGGVLTNNCGRWLSNGLGVVIFNGRCGYLNTRGQIQIPPKFLMALPFSDNHAPVWSGTTWQYIDTQGNPVSQLRFSEIGVFEDGHATVEMPGPLYNLIENTNIAQKIYRFDKALNLVSKGAPTASSFNANSYENKDTDNDSP